MVVGTEILGAQLPSTAANWLLLLIGIVTALHTVVLTTERFVESLGGNANGLHRYGNGLVLPVSWTAWCVLLLISQPSVATVLVVLLGTLAMTITARRMARKCGACPLR